TDNLDCNDSISGINPEATEVCNGIDDNCNALTDEGVLSIFYADEDGDSYGNEASNINACSAPSGYVSNHDDCNDDPLSGSLIHPSSDEVCNGLDDNCNDAVDEGVQSTFYEDADGDGYGNVFVTALACSVPTGFANNNTDCDDDALTGSLIHPSAPEICNMLDDNCDGAIDEGVQSTFYADADGDSYGNFAVSALACNVPAGFSVNGLDCNDNPSSGATIYPGAAEVCNNTDDNCNAQTDEGVAFNFYMDADNDSYGSASVTTTACSAPPGFVSNALDCDDNLVTGAAIHPGMPDVCNLVDDNCNGITDENAITATISPAGTAIICLGSSVTFTANSGTSVSYQWIKNGYDLPGATNKIFYPGKIAIYTVREKNSFNCSSTSAGTTLTASSPPIALITPLGNLDICQTGAVTLQAKSGTSLTYQWIKGGTNIVGATNQTYSANLPDVYKVKVTNSSGCSTLSIGTTVTKSCKEENIVTASAPAYFNFYPNPTDGRFMISLSNEADQQQSTSSVPVIIEIRDALGQLVYQEKTVMEHGKLQHGIILSKSLPQGLYGIRLLLPDEVFEGKVVYQQ
ncbi:MAG: MopE-related protein, partial [Chitinophagales bacterium]